MDPDYDQLGRDESVNVSGNPEDVLRLLMEPEPVLDEIEPKLDE
jgi:hypothetical protein